MLVLAFHGFYDNARHEETEDRLAEYVERNGLNAVTVYPVGSGDPSSGDSYSWNVEGGNVNLDNGPLGATCATPRIASSYTYDSNIVYKCFDSCFGAGQRGCDPKWGCNFAACFDDRRFVRALVRALLTSMCIDLRHVHLTGISAGGLMAYQTALDLPDLIASVAPIAGSRVWGYNRPPRSAVSLLDVHGYEDTYVPANASNGLGGAPTGAATSHDYFYYHEVPHVTHAFARAAGCDFGANLPFRTKFDGLRGFVCNQPHGRCAGAAVVQCVGNWAHTWPLHHAHPHAYADLVFDFFRSHPRATPVGLNWSLNWSLPASTDAAEARRHPLNTSSSVERALNSSSLGVASRTRSAAEAAWALES